MQINRLFEIVYILLAQKSATAKELAERFEVSQRTIYRDVETLSLAGIPIFTEKGKGGGISLLPDFVLNKSILSEDEQSEILAALQDGVKKVRIAFEYVRDEISHNWDIQSERVTRTASEVLMYKEGMCYAKSMLLAALLRCQGIPTGFCYQRITLGNTPGARHAIHALNAVFL